MAPSEPHSVEKVVVYKAADEQIMLRLGGALVLQWDALPDALQDLLIDQAAIGNGEAISGEAIENFIRKAKTAALQPPPAAEDETPAQ